MIKQAPSDSSIVCAIFFFFICHLLLHLFFNLFYIIDNDDLRGRRMRKKYCVFLYLFTNGLFLGANYFTDGRMMKKDDEDVP
jgi:hypothetical protein